MRLNISAAARLYGIHRATIHRHLKSGRLSCGLEADGSRSLDLSELIRCYGEPPNAPEDVRQVVTPDATPKVNGDATPPVAASTSLLERFDALLSVVTEQRDELRALRKEVKDLRGQLALPAPPQKESSEQRRDAKKDPVPDDGDPHGFRRLIRAMRDSEQ